MDVRNIICELQPYISTPPISTVQAHGQACSNDQATIEKWYDIWISNVKANKERFGSFSDHSVGDLHNSMFLRPCILAGSGPSLKRSVFRLKDRPDGMGLVSCLHNFHYMEDHDAKPDYYVSLDAGPITVTEVSEGGKKTADEYWEISKKRTLICYIGTNPELLEKWQGSIYFFNAPVPHDQFRKEIAAIEPFNVWVESGGNVFGAALMLSKGFLGSQISIFVGADFSFSNENKRTFHSWDSSYDKTIGNCIRCIDIYGNSVLSWPSYRNFKLWFDCVAQRVPGIDINATEGGCFGAYPEGNLMCIIQQTLENVFETFNVSRHKKNQAERPNEDNKEVYI